MRRYAVVLVIFASLCLAQSSPDHLTIVVEDFSGAPIPEASVHVLHWVRPESKPGFVAPKAQLIQDGIATTDAHGRAGFNLPSTAVYEVFASAPAFEPAAASVGNQGETGHVFKLEVVQGGGVRVESPPK